MPVRPHPTGAWRNLLVVVGLLAPVLPSQQPPPTDAPLSGAARDAFLKDVATRMKAAPAVAASFVQRKHLALFGAPVETRGHILFARPDRLRWEIDTPFRSILIAAGREVAKFEFQGGKRRRLELGRSADLILLVMEQIRGWFAGEFHKGLARYHTTIHAGRAAVKAEGRTPARPAIPARIELRPKDSALAKNLAAIELELGPDRSTVRRVTIREKTGDKTVMEFTPLRRTALAPAYFDLREPKALDPKELQAVPPTSRPTGRAGGQPSTR
ncbi:MAG: outer membrane lipoprotein carrier protein LolA [Planctomycetes bacterium]|nr:outer membrane lipoprotein carrier protein LolA [Planctomycetota bacterium]